MLLISLEQWRALVGVVDAGSYALAAEALGKSQSSVSYAVAQIEERTGVQVFRIQGRKAILTAEGKALYLRARYLLAEAGRLEKAAAQMALGHEAELDRGRHFDLRIPLAQHTDICSAQTDERWETRAILGEKIWLDRDVTAIRDDHLRAVRWIATGSSLCSVPLIIGLVWLDPWATAFGAAGMFFGQAWLLDRFAWLYETKRSCSSDVGRHG